MPDLYEDVQHLPPIRRSDHQCLLITPIIRQKIPSVSRKVRVRKTENVNALGLKLKIADWANVYNSGDVDEKVAAFKSIIVNALDDAMPMRYIRMHPSDKPWITPHIKILIPVRQRAFVKGKKQIRTFKGYDCMPDDLCQAELLPQQSSQFGSLQS